MTGLARAERAVPIGLCRSAETAAKAGWRDDGAADWRIPSAGYLRKDLPFRPGCDLKWPGPSRGHGAFRASAPPIRFILMGVGAASTFLPPNGPSMAGQVTLLMQIRERGGSTNRSGRPSCRMPVDTFNPGVPGCAVYLGRCFYGISREGIRGVDEEFRTVWRHDHGKRERVPCIAAEGIVRGTGYRASPCFSPQPSRDYDVLLQHPVEKLCPGPGMDVHDESRRA